MGMSASQARLLNLQARQNNLEYQGQQINQERSILSQQCTDLYNSLLNMKVPTPPSTQDYTKVQYSGVDGATTFTIGTVKPSGDMYSVEIQQSATGKSISKDYGTATCSKAGSELEGKTIPAYQSVELGTFSTITDNETIQDSDIVLDEKWYTQEDGTKGTMSGAEFKAKNPTANMAEYMVQRDGKYQKVSNVNELKDTDTVFKISSKEAATADGANRADFTVLRKDTENQSISINASDIHNYYLVDENGNAKPLVNSNFVEKNEKTGEYTFITELPANIKLFHEELNGGETAINPDAGQQMIAGKLAYDFETAAADPKFKDFDWDGYRTAIQNTYNGELKPENFMVYFETSATGTTSVKFALTSDVTSPDNFTETYSFSPNGTFTTSEEVDKCDLQFDAAGMITKVGIPKYDSAGKLTGYNYVELTAEKVTDNAAYQDAYSEYEYAQYEYDRKQQEINAKTEVIQQQDRNLELKLQRLDNERTQITTEIEAVEKVINDNIESTYKTFSG